MNTRSSPKTHIYPNMNTYLIPLVGFCKTRSLLLHHTAVTVFARANNVIKKEHIHWKYMVGRFRYKLLLWFYHSKSSTFAVWYYFHIECWYRFTTHWQRHDAILRRAHHDYQMFRRLQAMQLPKSAAQYEWFLCRIYLCSFNFAALAIKKYYIITVLSTNLLRGDAV